MLKNLAVALILVSTLGLFSANSSAQDGKCFLALSGGSEAAGSSSEAGIPHSYGATGHLAEISTRAQCARHPRSTVWVESGRAAVYDKNKPQMRVAPGQRRGGEPKSAIKG